MSKTHWVDYSISLNVKEETSLEVANKVKMLKVSAASLTTTGGKSTLTLTMGSTAYDLLYVGGADTADKEKAAVLSAENTFTFDGPALSAPFVVSMHSAKNDSWYEREITAAKDQKALLIDYVTVLKPLAVENTTGMFKAAAAFLKDYNGEASLVVSLTGKSYHYLYKGTYEAASANGNNRDNWIAYTLNADDQYTFEIPLEKDETFIPVVSISSTYLTKFENGEEPLERSFYPRQFVLNTEAMTLTAGDYDETVEVTVSSSLKTFRVAEKASMRVVGGPNSNNYSCTPTLVMLDDTYDQVSFPAIVDGELAPATAQLSENKTFTIPLQNAPKMEVFRNAEPVSMNFRIKETGKWISRQVTIDKLAKTIRISGEEIPEAPVPVRCELSAVSYVYNGGSRRPVVTVYDKDGKVYPKELYSVIYPEASKKAGTYQVTVRFKDSSIAPMSASYTIEKSPAVIKLSDLVRRADSKSFQLTKKTEKGGGIVSYTIDNSQVAAVTSSGKVTIKGCGTAKITASAPETANFKAVTKTITLTVNPRPSVLDRVYDNGNGSWRAIVRQVADVDNYHLMYADNPEFKNAKTLTIRTGIHSYTRKGFRKGETWYIKVRTSRIVDGVRYYSNWSGTKSVALKK